MFLKTAEETLRVTWHGTVRVEGEGYRDILGILRNLKNKNKKTW